MFNKFIVKLQTVMGKSANGNSKSLAKLIPLLILIYVSLTAIGQTPKQTKANSSALTAIESKIRDKTTAIESKLIGWRRDIHQNPELGDQEERTSKLVAEHLRTLGIEVQTGVGGTGVMGILKGGKPGQLVALRADMDALAVKEPAGLPFASKATAQLNGTTVYLMHACGHDAHTAMLMATAEVLASVKSELSGSVMFIFQPAEEGSSVVEPGTGKSWGAKRMLEDGMFKKNKPDAVFALHVHPGKSGQIDYKSGPATASSDVLNITVSGQQGHGGMPWNTIDPVVASAYIIAGLQSVVSRRADLTKSPAVVSVGMIHGGSSQNVIPDTVKMVGTIRSYDPEARKQLHTDIKQAAEHIAEGTYATAQVDILPMYDVTDNNDALAKQMLPVLKRAAEAGVVPGSLQGASEDFSYFAKEVPGLYIFLGVTPEGEDPAKAAPNHNPKFFVDEKALVVGTRAMAAMAVNFLMSGSPN
ncbi:amidohydrolase [Dyadobacter sp. CY107]|uniref:amidohydrolase n=1 Tax=Dyadobacter fanqingshengii TaxID=2906443 RepID=UPI001F225B4A|nr:amidohydrolase [Dyadobacter fanqingshengii]MCF2502166.1 amidohydrolase [Dyadobacter fanqingshengii]